MKANIDRFKLQNNPESINILQRAKKNIILLSSVTIFILWQLQ